MSVLESLQSRKNTLKTQVNDLEAAITALEANPEILNVLELIRKVQRF